MPTPREQSGGLAEASRLLQEGLQLLDQRARDVDDLVARAQERARQMTAEAEQRVAEITADGERQRVELEEQVAALRGEIAAAREELAQLRSPGAAAARPADAGTAADAPAAGTAAASGAHSAEDIDRTALASAQLEAREVADAAEAAGTPRWGRRSTVATAQQAIRTRSARPRWLPPWLPFLVVLLAAAAVVAATVDGQGARPPAAGATAAPDGTGAITRAPNPAVGAVSAGSSVGAATAASIATLIVATANNRPPPPTADAQAQPPAPTEGLQAPADAQPSRLASFSSVPTPAVASRDAAFAATALLTPTPLAPTPTPVALPTARPLLANPVQLPADVSPEGPIVAAYTIYATYIVRPGDTLNRIATEYGVRGDEIVRTSGLDNPNLLRPGQVLTIPRDSGWLYRVQPNETLSQIAVRFGVSADDLSSPTGAPPGVVRAGELLFIPNRALPAPKN